MKFKDLIVDQWFPDENNYYCRNFLNKKNVLVGRVCIEKNFFHPSYWDVVFYSYYPHEVDSGFLHKTFYKFYPTIPEIIEEVKDIVDNFLAKIDKLGMFV